MTPPAEEPSKGESSDHRPHHVEQSAVAHGNSSITQVAGDYHNYNFAESQRALKGPSSRDTPSPYPGLRPFGKDRAGQFAGRGKLVQDLSSRLSEKPGVPLMVVGPSGSGKSSLLMAGLLHELSEGRVNVPTSRHWRQIVMAPGRHPLTELAEKLGRNPQQAARIGVLLAGDPSRLAEAWREIGQEHSDQIILIIDQLEEVFTLCEDAAERHRFVEAVSRLATDGPVARLVFGLRADFYGHCLEYPVLKDALQRNQVPVGPMDREQLEEAIIKPAASVDHLVEPELVKMLLLDMGVLTGASSSTTSGPWSAAGQLPLLSHALANTWSQREGRALTVAGYQQTGGIQNALNQTAENCFARLDGLGREAAERLFPRLVRIADDAEDTRQRVTPAELGIGLRPAVVEQVLAVFHDARLLTWDRNEDGTGTVQLAHEAMIRAWQRLRDWVNASRGELLVRQELEATARSWQASQRDSALLVRGSRLERADQADQHTPGELSETAAAFLQASRLAAAAVRQAAARAVRVRRAVIAGLTVLTLIASTAAVIAFQQRATAQHQRDLAIAGQIATEADRIRATDPSLAAQLDLASDRINPSQDRYTDLLATESSPLATALPIPAKGPAFDGDGHRMATIGTDKTVSLWDTTDPAHPRLAGTVPTFANWLAVSPDGRFLALSVLEQNTQGPNDAGGTVLWDVADPAHPRPTGAELTGGVLEGGAFAADGKSVATTTNESATVWDLADPAHPAVRATALGKALALSPDGRTLAVSSGGFGAGNAETLPGGLRLLDVSGPGEGVPQLPDPLDLGGDDSAHARFSADGHHLVATGGQQPGNTTLSESGYETPLRSWDITDRSHPVLQTERVFPEQVDGNSIALRPDAQVVAAQAGKSVQLWRLDQTPTHHAEHGGLDIGDLQPLGLPLSTENGTISDFTFSPDGSTLATTFSSRVWLWNLPPTQATPGGNIQVIDYLSDGKGLATASNADGGAVGDPVRLWQVTAPNRAVPVGDPILGQSDKTAKTVAVSPDGRTLATSDPDHNLRLWDLTDPARPTPLAEVNDTRDFVGELAFTADGRTLWDVQEKVAWDVSDRSNPREYPTNSLSNAGGQTVLEPQRPLLVVSSDNGIGLWDARDPARLGPLGAVHSSSDDAVVIAPGGGMLATTDRQAGIQLWSIADPHHPAKLASLAPWNAGAINEMAFSAKTPMFATVSEDNSLRLWDLSDPHHPQQIGRPLPWTGYDGLAFSPDGRSIATSGAGGTLQLWDLDVSHAIDRICATTSGALTPEVWAQHFSGISFRTGCR
ncbi:hypothetical protein E6W39_03510 [Kitasatospora acidiphila]|uniref:Novel STAND NTPase 1 domain-containing protein n=1 Tax=Kitasatospora acidiphila TaxID=2567942 RepID=A0A540VXK2_9ACTN|nr:PD40 domain-containing protein [Kitasatospora acidiphila]TQF01483.1 hypothetical protein E6W39_03510 [Kitasatospora acidiphila]